MARKWLPNCPDNPDKYGLDRCIIPKEVWPGHKIGIYRECYQCLSRVLPVNFGGIKIRFGRCENLSCQRNTPLRDIMMGPPHMTGVCPGNCICDGRPWWWPGRASYLDEIR